MKVLIVISGNSEGIAPFVKEQVEALSGYNILFKYYFIKGKGIKGYLNNIGELRKEIKSYDPDIVHAHYGLSGFVSFLSKGKHILITTFHGNDINPIGPDVFINVNRFLSKITHYFSKESIFVNKDLALRINANPEKTHIIPCQVNLDIFYPIDKNIARDRMKLSRSKKYILFSSAFGNFIKNYPLASLACKEIDAELIELKGYTREEVNFLLNATDVALITSFNEGSCQFLKEAMACNCPIVSTRVGDANEVIGSTSGCYITSYQPEDVSEKIREALNFAGSSCRTDGRLRIIELMLDAENTSRKVYNVYKKSLR